MDKKILLDEAPPAAYAEKDFGEFKYSYDTSLRMCPLCNSMNITKFYTMIKQRMEWIYQRCNSCQNIFLWNRLSDEATDDFYLSGKYRQWVFGSDTVDPNDLLSQQARAQAWKIILNIPEIKPKNDMHSVMLDVGCSSGLMMKEFQLMGYNTVGVEPDPIYRKYALDHGCIVFETLPEVTGSYNIISLSHVLEHTNHPQLFISMVSEKLIPGKGVIIVEVPNGRADDGAYRPWHPLVFSDVGLVKFFEYMGFRLMLPSVIKYGINSPLDKNLLAIFQRVTT